MRDGGWLASRTAVVTGGHEEEMKYKGKIEFVCFFPLL